MSFLTMSALTRLPLGRGVDRTLVVRFLFRGRLFGALLLGGLLGCVGGAGLVPSTPAPPPPVPTGANEPVPGLTSAVAASTKVQLTFAVSNEGHEAALFQGSDPDTLFLGAPVETGLTGGDLLRDGLVDGDTYFFGLGLRASPGEAFVPSGPILRARPGAPIFVDPGADPLVADGTSPATAYANPILALIDSFGAGGANVWLLAGDYPASSLPVFAGTHLSGGFAPGFQLEERDPANHPSVLHGLAGQSLAAVQGLGGVVLDGLRLSGDGLATHGLDMDSTPLELRGVEVLGCTQRGVRVRAPEDGPATPVTLVDCLLSGNAAGGLSGLGCLDVRVFGSRFLGNGQEGLDLDDLIAADGESASLVVDGCTFASNATDGLDVDLNAPLAGGVSGGELEVRITRSTFVGNGEVGLLIDVDYLGAPLWKADIEVTYCVARNNHGRGFLVDVDERANVYLGSLVAEANGLAGVELSSSLVGGLAVLSGVASLGNLGPGFASTGGLVELLATHCLAAGNAGGGFVSPSGRGQASSSVTSLQTDPMLGFEAFASPDLGATWGVFLRAPEAFAVAGDVVAGQLVLPTSSVFASDANLEVDGDGIPRTLSVLSPVVIALDPAPVDQLGPISLMGFAPGDSVDTDFRLVPGSPLQGAGLAGLVDAGPAAAPGFAAEGHFPELLAKGLRLKALSPTIDAGLGVTTSLTLRFAGGTPSAVSIALALVVEDGAGLPVAFQAAPSGADWVLTPAGADWDPNGTGRLVVQLLPGLTDVSGAPNDSPLAVLFELH